MFKNIFHLAHAGGLSSKYKTVDDLPEPVVLSAVVAVLEKPPRRRVNQIDGVSPVAN